MTTSVGEGCPLRSLGLHRDSGRVEEYPHTSTCRCMSVGLCVSLCLCTTKYVYSYPVVLRVNIVLYVCVSVYGVRYVCTPQILVYHFFYRTGVSKSIRAVCTKVSGTLVSVGSWTSVWVSECSYVHLYRSLGLSKSDEDLDGKRS